MSINKVISVQNPILDAKEFLGIDHDKDNAIFTRWATLAEKEIGSYYQYERKRTVVTISGCTACLPTDAVLVEIAVIGDLGTDCGDLLNRFCGTINVTTTNMAGQSNFLVIDIGGTVGETINFGYMTYAVQDNKIVLDTNRDGVEMTIQYLRYKTDCDGFMEVGENHVNAIRWFITWMYYMRGKNKNYIDRDLISMARQEWDRECRHARAEDNRLSYSQHMDAARMYSNPYTGRGIWQGLYTTLGNSFFIWD